MYDDIQNKGPMRSVLQTEKMCRECCLLLLFIRSQRDWGMTSTMMDNDRC